jgi:hypothetical protein
MTKERSMQVDEHAKVVAARWAEKMPAAVADGMSAEEFLRTFKRFLLWGGWNAATADKMVARTKQLYERGFAHENKAENLQNCAQAEPAPACGKAGL